MEDEVIGIRRRRADLERALLNVDDPSAIALIKLVLEDMSARIAALEATLQPQAPPETKLAVDPQGLTGNRAAKCAGSE